MEKYMKIIWVIIFWGFAESGYAQSGWAQQVNPIAPSKTNVLGKVQFVSVTEGWISGANGNLLHTTNSGTTWNIVKPFPNDTVSSIGDPSISMWWVNQTHGWKINWFGTNLNDAHGAVLQQTTDGGITWTKKIFSTTAGDAGLEVQFADENHGWILIYNFISGNPQYLKTTDGGSSWNPFIGMGIFYFADANNGWAISAAGAQSKPPYKIYHTTNGGNDWVEQYVDSTAGSFNAIQFTDINNGWVVGENSKILKTTDGGNHWIKVTNTGINSSSMSKCVFFLDANTGWIGTNDGDINNNPARILLYTTNGGTTWTKQNPPISNAVFSIYFLNSNTGWITADNCVQNCDQPDSLIIWQGAIYHFSDGLSGVEDENNTVLNNFDLLQNYPNPFNPTTTISFVISQQTFVTLKVYDVMGKEVSTLVNENKAAGKYRIDFDASGLTSGVYFYKLQTDKLVQTKKLLLLK